MLKVPVPTSMDDVFALKYDVGAFSSGVGRVCEDGPRVPERMLFRRGSHRRAAKAPPPFASVGGGAKANPNGRSMTPRR